jgi:aspartate/methionine/tyrosine aminotransferase
MPTLADHARWMPRSGIREVMDLAWSMSEPVIGLHVGEPSFATPEHVLDGVRRALDRGETRYVANAGIPELREAIAAKVAERNGLQAEPEQVVVAAGGMQALYAALSATVGAGDEVLIPDPGWPNFAMAVQLVQARPVGYPLHPDDVFLPDVAELGRRVTDRTRALIVNFPSNPLGAVLPAELAERLCRFVDEHDLWLISDECYDAITFDAEHVSPGGYDEQDRVLSCFSFSKTYAMTGMRVGYLVAPRAVAEIAAKMQEPLIACVNAPAQYAALAALEGPQDFVEVMRRAYHERRDAAAAQLDTAGFGYLLPQGAFYMWVDVRDRCGGDVKAWALELLRERHVAVAPGTTFGAEGEGWVRISLATDTDDLLEGLDRLAAVTARQK